MPSSGKATPKRDELVDIASRLFYEQGFGATGIKQIIETAGIAKGTFYSHFSSKEEVGVAWLKKRHTLWNDWLQKKLDEGKSPKGKILALFDFLEQWMQESNYRGCAFLNTLSEFPDPTNPMRQEIEAHKKGLKEAIQELTSQHFSKKPSSFTSHKGTIIFLLFEGALVEAQNFRDAWPITSARKEIKNLLAAEG